MKYLVTYNIFAKYETTVEADDIYDAAYKADFNYQETAFKDIAEIVEGYVYSITSEGGKTHYEI